MYWHLICLLIMIVIISGFAHVSEHFSTHQRSEVEVYLLGDDSVDNSRYVSDKYSVAHLVRKSYPKTHLLATRGSTIHDLRSQSDQIPPRKDREPRFIIVSIGTHYLLSHYRENPPYELSHVTDTSTAFAMNVMRIRDTHPNDTIILLNAYYPRQASFLKYRLPLIQWNQETGEFAKRIGAQVIQTQSLMLSTDDFIQSIYPSAVGSRLIAEAITQQISSDTGYRHHRSYIQDG